MKVNCQRVLIIRDSKTKVSTSVPLHELQVLKVIHGTENIEELGEAAPRELDDDLDTEVERLISKYGSGAIGEAFGGKLYRDGIKAALKAAEVTPATKSATKKA